MLSNNIVIKAKSNVALPSLREIWQYRELISTFVTRDLKVRYRQTVIGGLWAIFQPLTTMVIFSFFFGYIAKIPGEGVPYPVFSYAGLVLWIYFTGALTAGSASVVSGANLLSKVYFPRIILPIAATITGLIDYMIALSILVGLMIYYSITPSIYLLLLPIIIFMTWVLAMGISFWLSAINVKYRDVGYVIPFMIQLMLYVTPVIYPTSIAPNYAGILQLNPMTGIIEAHRAVILGKTALNWSGLAISLIITSAIWITGALYFRKMERRFADIV